MVMTMSKNSDRTRKALKLMAQLHHCRKCLDTLMDDFDASIEKQNNDSYDAYHYINNHTVYANDIRYIRRQLLKAEKMFEEDS